LLAVANAHPTKKPATQLADRLANEKAVIW
jgi:hypothetical protein